MRDIPAVEPLTQGTWHIIETSLALWRSRRAPAVTYAPLPDGRLLDVVTYASRRGRPRRIVGIDTPSDDDAWRWRGLDLITRFTHSDWRFVAGDAANGWAVTAFARTPFTAAGVDLYFRDPDPADTLVECARAACATDEESALFIPALFRTRR